MRKTGQPPGADVSLLKIPAPDPAGAHRLMMRAAGLAANWALGMGVEGGSIDALASRFTPRYCNYRKTSIYAGSTWIQRNIIAKATLGL